jgi:hypothetical protein
LQGLKISRVQFARHTPQAKPTITNKGFNTLASLCVSIATEIQLWDGMGNVGHLLSIKWKK